jgi:peptidoglycan/LPS O-acetylase OafA/YrhL
VTGRLRGVGIGLGAALAVSLPPALLAQVLDAVLDDDLPLLVTTPLAVAVLGGAVAGGWAVARRSRGPRLLGALVGAVVLGLVVGLGVLRERASGEEARAAVVPVAMVAGAALGLLGSSLGARRAARTRP